MKLVHYTSGLNKYSTTHFVLKDFNLNMVSFSYLSSLLSRATDYQFTPAVNTVHLLSMAIILHRIITVFVMDDDLPIPVKHNNM